MRSYSSAGLTAWQCSPIVADNKCQNSLLGWSAKQTLLSWGARNPALLCPHLARSSYSSDGFIEGLKMAPTVPSAVVLTGFGPFGDHKTNDSWTAVREVAEGERGKLLENRLGVQFIVREMPVCYEYADRTVPQLWTEHNPLFVLHVGIHKDDLFRIETKSRRADYHNKDIEGCTPDSFLCTAGTSDVMETTLDVNRLLSDVRQTLADRKTDVGIALSDDPGNYLCGYTYYTSLCRDAGRTLFLHIPPPCSSVPVSHKADVVEAVVTYSVVQIRQRSCRTTAV